MASPFLWMAPSAMMTTLSLEPLLRLCAKHQKKKTGSKHRTADVLVLRGSSLRVLNVPSGNYLLYKQLQRIWIERNVTPAYQAKLQQRVDAKKWRDRCSMWFSSKQFWLGIKQKNLPFWRVSTLKRKICSRFVCPEKDPWSKPQWAPIMPYYL